MTQRHIGNLQVADFAGGKVALQFGGDVAFDNLAVEQIHLHFQIGLVHLRQYFVRMVLAVDKKSGNPAQVNGLKQDIQALCAHFLASPL